MYVYVFSQVLCLKLQSTEMVLVLQYMDGVRLSDVAALDELGVDKQALVETITRSYAHQIYVDGFFNGDPHPGKNFAWVNVMCCVVVVL